MASTKVLYTGDAVRTQFPVTFPFLSPAHVDVFINLTKMLDPLNYTLSGSTVTFYDAPEIDDAIELRRVTSPNDPIVDFTDGSQLKELDLDNAYLHNFYLGQEYAENFNDLINETFLKIASGTGIIETTTSAIIAALVNEMLNTEQAATIQQRVVDIDANAEAILQLGTDLQVQMNVLAGQTAALVYVQPGEPVPGVGGVPDPIPEGARWYDSDDNNKPYLYQSSTWLSIEDPRIGIAQADIVLMQVELDDTISAILVEQLVRSTETSGLATTLSLLGAQNAAQTAFILDTSIVKIDSDAGDTFATRLSNLSAADGSNAADILTEQTSRISADGVIAADITLLGARNGSSNAFILNEDTVKIASDSGDTIATRFSGLTAADSTNAAAVITEQNARISGDSANASTIASLDARVVTTESDIGTAQGDIIANAASIVSEASVRASADSAHASDITVLQADVDLRATTFFQATAPTANNVGDLWIDSDDDSLYRWNGTVWVSIIDAAIGANATSITNLTADVVSNDGELAANASSITTLQADVITVDGRVDSANINISANVSAITGNDTDITSLYARYGVTLNVNNYITGFAQNNDGTTGSFVILADQFAVVTPNTPWAATTSKNVGDMVRPSTPNSRVFKCTQAGTTNSSEPTWDTVVGNSTTDNDIIWQTVDDVPIIPFLVQDGVVKIQNLEINGSLLLSGSVQGAAIFPGGIGATQIGPNAITTDKLNANVVTTDKLNANSVTAAKISVTNLAAITANLGAITAGSIVLNTSGFIRGGQTAYNTGSGFFLGYDAANYKFSIGNGGSNIMTWDGTSLLVKGDIRAGLYVNGGVQTVLASALTTRTHPHASTWTEYKKFEVTRSGTIRVSATVKLTSSTPDVVVPGGYRIKVDGVVVYTNSTIGSQVTLNIGVAIADGDQFITLELDGGGTYDSVSGPFDTDTVIVSAQISSGPMTGEKTITD